MEALALGGQNESFSEITNRNYSSRTRAAFRSKEPTRRREGRRGEKREPRELFPLQLRNFERSTDSSFEDLVTLLSNHDLTRSRDRGYDTRSSVGKIGSDWRYVEGKRRRRRGEERRCPVTRERREKVDLANLKLCDSFPVLRFTATLIFESTRARKKTSFQFLGK